MMYRDGRARSMAIPTIGKVVHITMSNSWTCLLAFFAMLENLQ
ncbi:hypothetical protein GCK32_016685 [Trichostrongylus colubriformis]|uniref:Uncharacterized protein n=1 Tax=Trichostrongylus colubriformis TaxID=6319 RepID=A0AAN8F2N3_TRICO